MYQFSGICIHANSEPLIMALQNKVSTQKGYSHVWNNHEKAFQSKSHVHKIVTDGNETIKSV